MPSSKAPRCIAGDGNRRALLTFHGLRHTYAAEMYKLFVMSGKDEHTAKLEVSRLLGHEREDVTNIYLASVKRANNVCCAFIRKTQ